MGSRVISLPSKDTLHAASSHLSGILREVSNHNKPLLLLLSGGSALMLLDHIDTTYLDETTTIAPLDERFSNNPEENNMSLIMATPFFEHVKRKGVSFIDTRVQEKEIGQELSERFNRALEYWISKNPHGVLVATMGIGSDGHTAGIMPFPENPNTFNDLFEGDRFVVYYDATGKNPFTKRVTTTMTFLRKIDEAILYAVGDTKKDALKRVLAKEGSLEETPARIIHEMKNVSIFTDYTGV